MYNSKYKVKYNSKVAEVRNIDPAVNTDYQKMVGESAFGEPAEQRMGNVHMMPKKCGIATKNTGTMVTIQALIMFLKEWQALHIKVLQIDYLNFQL